MVSAPARIDKAEELKGIFDAVGTDVANDLKMGGAELGREEEASIVVELPLVVAAHGVVAAKADLLAGKKTFI